MLRKIHTCNNHPLSARVYRDSEWNEYRVRFYRDGKHIGESSDYVTNDRVDAIKTAESTLTRGF